MEIPGHALFCLYYTSIPYRKNTKKGPAAPVNQSANASTFLKHRMTTPEHPFSTLIPAESTVEGTVCQTEVLVVIVA